MTMPVRHAHAPISTLWRTVVGAEAILKFRALIINGDLGQYWRYHLRREH